MKAADIPNKWAWPWPPQEEELRQLVVQHKSNAEIAKALQRSETAIQSHKIRLGIAAKQRGRKKKRLNLEWLLARRLEGLSLKAIGSLAGVS